MSKNLGYRQQFARVEILWLYNIITTYQKQEEIIGQSNKIKFVNRTNLNGKRVRARPRHASENFVRRWRKRELMTVEADGITKQADYYPKRIINHPILITRF